VAFSERHRSKQRFFTVKALTSAAPAEHSDYHRPMLGTTETNVVLFTTTNGTNFRQHPSYYNVVTGALDNSPMQALRSAPTNTFWPRRNRALRYLSYNFAKHQRFWQL